MEQVLFTNILDNYKAFSLILVRVAGFIFLMPIFSSKTLPMVVKAASCLVISTFLLPLLKIDPVAFPTNLPSYLILVVAELFVGMTMALMLRLLFAGLQTAGQMTGFQMGFSVANVVDPSSGAQSVIIAQFVYLIGLLLFLTSNAHHFIIYGLYESFSILKPGQLVLAPSLHRLLMDMGQMMFVLSIKILAPVLAILFLSQAALGVLAKVVPQINVLMVSFSLNIGLGLFFLGLSMQFFWPIFSKYLERSLRLIPVALRLFAGQ